MTDGLFHSLGRETAGGGRTLQSSRSSALGRGLVALALLLTACSDSTTPDPGSLRFGQVGEIRIRLVTPLPGATTPSGELQQALTWNSEGPWQLYESIAYRGLIGDESLTRGVADPGDYAALLIQLNETPGLRLFTDDLDPDLDPVCMGADTRISFLIRDNYRNEEMRWNRCSGETLESLTEGSSGPDAGAARIITASRRARDFTLGDSFRSSYSGSVAFGTLDRGEQSLADLTESVAFVGLDFNGEFVTPVGWEDFWSLHTGSSAPPPTVDWSEDMVLVGAVGRRQEAGDSVEIRRILQVESGTNVEVYERVPGDFCSPAAQSHTPFHIVLVPRTRPSYRFGEAKIERVPCGA